MSCPGTPKDYTRRGPVLDGLGSASEAGFDVEEEDVGGVGVGDGHEAEFLVEVGGGGVFGAEANTVEMLAAVVEEPADHGRAESLFAPGGADVDAANAADAGGVEEGIAIEAADGDEQAVLDGSAEDFAGCGETILAAGPFADQFFDELVVFLEGFGAERADAGESRSIL